MYEFIKIMHKILIEFHGNYMELKICKAQLFCCRGAQTNCSVISQTERMILQINQRNAFVRFRYVIECLVLVSISLISKTERMIKKYFVESF